MLMILVTIASTHGGEIALSKLVNRVIGQDEAAENYDARYRAAESLTRQLLRTDARRLIEWLMDPVDPLPPMAAAAIRHETTNQLIKAGLELDALNDALTRSFNDPRQSEVWRDYCLQHFGTLLQLLDQGRATAAQDFLWQATDERTGAMAGTALIALQRNLEHGVPQSQLADRAAEIAADTRFGGGTRATALQILAEFDDVRALPPARAVLETSRDVLLRVSALGVLGTMGEARDANLVERYMQSSIPVLRSVAVTAQGQLKNNL